MNSASPLYFFLRMKYQIDNIEVLLHIPFNKRSTIALPILPEPPNTNAFIFNLSPNGYQQDDQYLDIV